MITVPRIAIAAATVTAMGAFVAASEPASAHHSFAMFDSKQTKELVGTVRTIQWTMPHGYMWMYVSNGKGGTDTWAIEGGFNPNGLQRRGWTKDSIKPGEKVTAYIHPLKDGRTGGSLVRLTLADGRTLGSGGQEIGRGKAGAKAGDAGGE